MNFHDHDANPSFRIAEMNVVNIHFVLEILEFVLLLRMSQCRVGS